LIVVANTVMFPYSSVVTEQPLLVIFL